MTKGWDTVSDGLVVIASLVDAVEAEMVLGMLRAGGIEATVSYDPLSRLYGNLYGASTHDILVREEDAEAALALLESNPNEELDG